MKSRNKTNSNSSSKNNQKSASNILNYFNEVHYFKRPLRKSPSPNTRMKPEKLYQHNLEKMKSDLNKKIIDFHGIIQGLKISHEVLIEFFFPLFFFEY